MRKEFNDYKEFYLSYFPNCEIDAICSVCDYILNDAGDMDEEHMGRIKRNKLGLSSAKLSRAMFGCIEVMFEVVSKDDNLN